MLIQQREITNAHQKLAQLGSTQIMAGKMRERVSLSAVIRAIAARMFLATMEREAVMMILNVQDNMFVVLTTVKMVHEDLTVALLPASMTLTV